ncbi:hypothetical protein ClosIBUN125C_CONTIG18g01129, partial [Clostridium sp. IBUN125C]
MGEHTTLNECSYKLGISIVTAFHWRHKIFHAIENNYKPEKFDEVVDVDTYYTEKCYKGSRNKIQRYKCKNEECKKTFSNTTNSVWKYLKHKPEKWFEFIELMGEHTTLNECAAKLEISIVTAFYWRHKIFHAIENNYKPEKFDEVVDVDTYYTEKCYKGSRNKNYTYADKVKNKFDKMYGLVPRSVSVLIAEESGKMPLIRKTESNETIVNNFNNNVLKIASKDCYMRTDHFT